MFYVPCHIYDDVNVYFYKVSSYKDIFSVSFLKKNGKKQKIKERGAPMSYIDVLLETPRFRKPVILEAVK